MTISSSTSRNNYIGAGSAGPFAFGFRIFAATDLQVVRRSAAGIETAHTYPLDFSIAAGGVGNRNGGSITLTTALAVGDTLAVRRVLPLKQSTDLRNLGAYLPEAIEDQFDRLVMIDQQHEDDLARALRLPVSVDPGVVSPQLPVPQASTVLAWDALGQALTNRILDASTNVALPGNTRTVATLTAYLANNAVFNVRDFGAVGNGVADDTTPVRNAVNAAIAAGVGIVQFWPGRYRLTSTITMPSAVTLLGMGTVPGGINNAANGYPTILHDFNGDMFVWNGANGLTAGSGGGAERLRVVQVFGAPGAGAGSAFVARSIDAAHKPSWIKWRLLVVEEQYTISAPWSWAFNIDGGATNILDMYIGEVSTHTSGVAPAEGALRLDGASQPVIYNCNFFNTGALIYLGDTNMSSSCGFMGCQAITLTLDKAQDTMWFGGILSNLNDTANTTGNNTIFPGRWSGAFVPLGGGAVGIMRYAATKNVGGAIGGWDFLRPIQIPNARYFAGVQNPATNISIALIGLDGGNNIRVGVNSDAIIVLGAGASLAGLGVGDTYVGGKLKVAGNVGFYGVAPVARAAAIATPNAQTGAYVQADVTSLKTAIDAIRVALQNLGLTL